MSDNNDSKPHTKTQLKQIKSSLFERTMSVAKMGLNAGFKYAAHKATGQDFDQYVTDQAESMTKELGQLKGSLMKAGQMLSMYGEYFLPPQANEFLKKLQADSPPVEWAQMKSYLETYLDAELIAELDINPVSIGSASMGQVHLAVIKTTGEKIALKIQYPLLENAIDSDIKSLKVLLQFSKLIPSEINLDSVFEEIKSMLRQELDYTLEAELTEKYRLLVGDDPRFVVPQVYLKYSTSKVLATNYIEGLKADHVLVQSLSQNRRNRLSENFIDLYFKELFSWNLVQTDPHLGNYKVQIDSLGEDRLVLLDFGACRSFPEAFMQSYKKMIKGSIVGDRDLFFTGAKGLGFIINTDKEDYIKAFTTFCDETVEPFWAANDSRNTAGKVDTDGRYQWAKTDLPSRVVKKAIQFKNFDLRTPPKDILFLDRKTGGVFIFLSVLKAHINARKVIDSYLKTV